MTDCHSLNAGDDGFELNSIADCILDGCTNTDSWNEGFFPMNRVMPWTGGAPGAAVHTTADGQNYTFRNCIDYFTAAVSGSNHSGWEIGAGYPNQALLPLGTVTLEGCSQFKTNTEAGARTITLQGARIRKFVLRDFTVVDVGGSVSGTGQQFGEGIWIGPLGDAEVVVENVMVKAALTATGGITIYNRALMLEHNQNAHIPAATSNGSAIVACPTYGLTTGLVIVGDHVPVGTTIHSIDSVNQLTMSANATGVDSQLAFTNACPGKLRFSINGLTGDFTFAASGGSANAGTSCLLGFGFGSDNPAVSGVIRRVAVKHWSGDSDPRPIMFANGSVIADRIDIEDCDFAVLAGAGGTDVVFLDNNNNPITVGGGAAGLVFSDHGNRWSASMPGGVAIDTGPGSGTLTWEDCTLNGTYCAATAGYQSTVRAAVDSLGIVHMEGVITMSSSLTPGFGAVVTLPTACWPATQRRITVNGSGNNAYQADVLTAAYGGGIQPVSVTWVSTEVISFDGVEFST